MSRGTGLPPSYHFLPHSIDFYIPGFAGDIHAQKTLTPIDRDCGEWFNDFVDRLAQACGRRYLPVCRISDGEFRFALGELAPDVRLPARKRARMRAAQVLNQVLARGTFEANVIPPTARLLYNLRLRDSAEAQTIGTYHSGEYSWLEWRRAREPYGRLLRQIGEQGILALHLMYGDTIREGHFGQFGRWLEHHGITLTATNYVPLPFVYSALTGSRRGELLRGKRVLAVTHAEESKRQAIEHSLRGEGVVDVHWQDISARRSFFDRFDPAPHVGQVDLALVGAGVGKPNILIQLAALNVPCIDVGFLFEIWNDPSKAQWRAYCAPMESPIAPTA